MALVADCDLLFAGDLCFFGVTPLAFQGDPATWADVLDAVADLADVIVPGHGPVGSATEVRELQAYLRHCVAGTIPPGPWDAWAERAERDPINMRPPCCAGDNGIHPACSKPSASPVVPPLPLVSAR
jgi:glyoxylase-like metal-dependent hydrolase (beta-lactamase superfamily II)